MQAIMNTQPMITRARLVLAALIVIATILFVVGVVIERSGSTDNHEVGTGSVVPTVATSQPPVSGEAGESGATHSAEQGQTTPVAHQETGTGEVTETVSNESGSETVLGINLENPWIVSAFVISWIFLLLGLFFLGRLGLILIVLASLGSGFFDIAEVIHQVGRSNAAVATIAILVATAHIGVLVLAAMALVRRVPPGTTPTSLPV